MMNKDIDWEDLPRRSTPIFRKDKHLSTALIITEIEYMLQNKDNPRGIKREHRELLQKIKDKEYLISEHFIPWFMKAWRDMASTHLPLTPLTTAIKVAHHTTRISVKDYTGQKCNLDLELTRDC